MPKISLNVIDLAEKVIIVDEFLDDFYYSALE